MRHLNCVCWVSDLLNYTPVLKSRIMVISMVITLDMARGSNRSFLLHGEFNAKSQVGLWPFNFIFTAIIFSWCQTEQPSAATACWIWQWMQLLACCGSKVLFQKWFEENLSWQMRYKCHINAPNTNQIIGLPFYPYSFHADAGFQLFWLWYLCWAFCNCFPIYCLLNSYYIKIFLLLFSKA